MAPAAGGSTRRSVVVVGAGIAGLAAAWEAAALGAEVVLLDADRRAGGKLASTTLLGRRIDTGADAFLRRRPEAVDFVRDVGLGDALTTPAATSALVWTGGQLQRLPEGLLLGVPTDLVSLARSGVLTPAGVARAALDLVLPGEPVAPDADIAVGELIRRRLGAEVHERLVDPLLGGINAGDSDHLSLQAGVPQLAAALQGHRSLIVGARRARRRQRRTGGAEPSLVPGEGGTGPADQEARRGAPAPAPEAISGALGRLWSQVVRRGNASIKNNESPIRAGQRSFGRITGRPGDRRQAQADSSQPASRTGRELPGARGGVGFGRLGDRILQRDQGPEPVFASVEGGLGRFADQVARRLGEHGVKLVLGFEAERLERRGDSWSVVTGRGARFAADAVILAVPPGPAAALLEPHAPAAAARLSGIDFASVAMVCLAYREEEVGQSLDGSGFLVPRRERRLMTACSWASSKWPDLAPPGMVVLRVSAGRAGDGRAMALADDVLVARLHTELVAALDISGEPAGRHVTRWVDGFPQYRPGHAALVDEVEGALPPGLEVAGAAYRGVGIPACIGSGQAAARRALAAAGRSAQARL